MKLWSWFKEDQVKRIAVRLDAAETPRLIRPDISYYRIRLVEMYLTKKTWMAKTWYPALYGSVLAGYNGKEIELPSVADKTKLFEQQAGTGDVIARNFFLTPLLPYSGSSVELACGLFALEGANYIAKVIGVLSDFSTLLAQPQVSTALAIAGPLAAGVQNLFGAKDGLLHLGYHDSWVAAGAGGSNTFRSGYLAVVRATSDEVDPQELRVVDQSLHLATNVGTRPLTAHDHMLLHIEERTERPDLSQLTSFYEPFQGALEALGDDATRADTMIRQALIAARVSPDLTQADRSRVTRELKQRYVEARDDLGFAALSTGGSLEIEGAADLTQHAINAEEALELGVPSFAELVAGL
jgi:hypothetical protein